MWADREPIVFSKDDWGTARRAVALLNEYLGRKYEAKRDDSDNTIYLVPGNPLTEKQLTVPERAAAEALTWYCREFTDGLKRDASVTFPKLIHYDSDAKSINDTPLTFCSESRAYMFAEVSERCFYCDAQVIETPAGWAVVVSKEDGLDAEDVVRMQGVCRVLLDYIVEDAGDGSASPLAEEMHYIRDLETAQTWRNRKNTQQQRIEDGINAILARLGDVGITEKAKVPVPAKPAGKKSSAKQSA